MKKLFSFCNAQRQLIFIYRIISVAIDFRRIASLIYVPTFIKDFLSFLKGGEKVSLLDIYPCLSDKIRSTPFDAHYFYQAAWLSRRLAIVMPECHVDIGSDIKIIAAISAFVPVEFADFRPLNVNLSNLSSISCDITNLHYESNSLMSLSCLHVVEHVGLGRYGDKINPSGTKKALEELARVLAFGGRLYLSLPVGRDKVCFNAHRVISPVNIISMLPSLKLIEFSCVCDNGHCVDIDMAEVSNMDYACGMFVFEK